MAETEMTPAEAMVNARLALVVPLSDQDAEFAFAFAARKVAGHASPIEQRKRHRPLAGR